MTRSRDNADHYAGSTGGIANTNHLVANANIVDNDFLRVDGTSIEGRTAAETLSDIGAIGASNPTVTLGSNATFPSGHLIKTTILEQAYTGSAISTGSTSPVDLGITGDHTFLLASSASFLVLTYSVGYSLLASGYGDQYFKINATTVAAATTTWAVGDMIRNDSNDYTHKYGSGGNTIAYHGAKTWIVLYGAGALPMTDNTTSWDAGDSHRFQIYGVTSNASGDAVIASANSNYMWLAQEFKL